jgi:hypothetical protein
MSILVEPRMFYAIRHSVGTYVVHQGDLRRHKHIYVT